MQRHRTPISIGDWCGALLALAIGASLFAYLILQFTGQRDYTLWFSSNEHMVSFNAQNSFNVTNCQNLGPVSLPNCNDIYGFINVDPNLSNCSTNMPDGTIFVCDATFLNFAQYNYVVGVECIVPGYSYAYDDFLVTQSGSKYCTSDLAGLMDCKNKILQSIILREGYCSDNVNTKWEAKSDFKLEGADVILIIIFLFFACSCSGTGLVMFYEFFRGWYANYLYFRTARRQVQAETKIEIELAEVKSREHIDVVVPETDIAQ